MQLCIPLGISADVAFFPNFDSGEDGVCHVHDNAPALSSNDGLVVAELVECLGIRVVRSAGSTVWIIWLLSLTDF